MEEYFKSQIEGKELKEWRSRKELEEYLLKEKRYCVIGYVTHKTLNKWGEELGGRGWITEENAYILQEGNEYKYLTFRKLKKKFIL